MHLEVAAIVAPVDIGYHARIYHGVIERCVEHGALVVISSFYLHFTQSPVPKVGGLAHHFVESLVLDFGFVVLTRSFDIDIRNSHFHLHCFALSGSKLGVEAEILACYLTHTGHHRRRCHKLHIWHRIHFVALANEAIGDFCTPNAVVFERVAECGIVVNGVIGISIAITPSATLGCTSHPSFYSVFVYYLDILLVRRTSHTACKVDLYARLRVFGICEAQHSTSGCCRTFHCNIIIAQANAIIACRGFFATLIDGRAIACHTAIFFTRHFL